MIELLEALAFFDLSRQMEPRRRPWMTNGEWTLYNLHYQRLSS